MPALNQTQPPRVSKLNNSGIEMNFIIAPNLLGGVGLQFNCDARDVALK
jgi:hypothetical protein